MTQPDESVGRGGSVTVASSWGGWRWRARFGRHSVTGRVRLGGEVGKNWAMEQGLEALDRLRASSVTRKGASR